jgi:hypothetical protein
MTCVWSTAPVLLRRAFREQQERSDIYGTPRPLLAPGLSGWFGKLKSEGMGERGYNTTPPILVQRRGSGYRTTYDHRQNYSLVTLHLLANVVATVATLYRSDGVGRLWAAAFHKARKRTGHRSTAAYWLGRCGSATYVRRARSLKPSGCCTER